MVRRIVIVFVLLALVTSFVVPVAFAGDLPGGSQGTSACGGLLTASSTSWLLYGQGANGYVNPEFQGSTTCPGP